jgi:hypothetical protein
MREWRKTHPPTEEQRRKMNCHSYAHVYLSRGKLTREPCKVCGSSKSQMHHQDYNLPLLVTWLCRPCHLMLHEVLLGFACHADAMKWMCDKATPAVEHRGSEHHAAA